MPKETFFNLAADKRSRIIDTAIHEFADNPYDVASISNIVREAGIAKGSFYQYFEDKQDIYRYLIELGIEEKLNLIKDLPAGDLSGNLFDYVRRLFQSAVQFELKEPGLAQVAYRAFVEEVPFPKMAEEMRRRGPTQLFKQLLTQGIHQGSVSPWADVNLAAFIMETTFYQFGRYAIKRLKLDAPAIESDQILEDSETQALLDNLMSIFTKGIAYE
ncbi:MAG: TetR/AcrR family transcriptional regulator [Anaerolineaceae bacterium]|nr:TetR/AcrR family transcriptional regulator [Anaerolineaceae bacterium]